MATGPIRNHRNKLVVSASRLHRARDRRAENRTLITGPILLAEATQAGVLPEVLFATPDDDQSAAAASRLGIELTRVDEQALRRLAATESPRGPVGVIPIPQGSDLSRASRLLVSWGVSDPGNVGTMIRVAGAFGWGFGFRAGTADPWAPKVLRSSAGAQFRVGLTSIHGLGELKDGGFKTVASTVAGGSPPTPIGAERVALLVGEEASGLPLEIVEACDVVVSIPMPGGTESLNAAVASGVLVYELSKPGETTPPRV